MTQNVGTKPSTREPDVKGGGQSQNQCVFIVQFLGYSFSPLYLIFALISDKVAKPNLHDNYQYLLQQWEGSVYNKVLCI